MFASVAWGRQRGRLGSTFFHLSLLSGFRRFCRDPGLRPGARRNGCMQIERDGSEPSGDRYPDYSIDHPELQGQPIRFGSQVQLCYNRSCKDLQQIARLAPLLSMRSASGEPDPAGAGLGEAQVWVVRRSLSSNYGSVGCG